MVRILESNTANISIFYVCMIISFIYQAVSSFMQFFVPRWLCYKRKDIRGQKILITGAGSGVGRQLALQFSKHDTFLILVGTNRQRLLQTEKLLDRRSPVFIYDCDVSDYKKVCEMAEKVKRDVGEVDILVNNAGFVSGQYLDELSEDNIRRTMGVNVLAHFWTVKAFLPSMMKRNSGHLVSVVSMGGKGGIAKLVDYCSSKYAALGFAETLEVELRERKLDGIKITTVCPSHIDSGLFEGAKATVGKIMTSEYVAKEIVLGVLEEQETIYLPYFLKYLASSKECFSRKFQIKFLEATGVIKGMEKFTGRQTNQTIKKDGK